MRLHQGAKATHRRSGAASLMVFLVTLLSITCTAAPRVQWKHVAELSESTHNYVESARQSYAWWAPHVLWADARTSPGEELSSSSAPSAVKNTTTSSSDEGVGALLKVHTTEKNADAAVGQNKSSRYSSIGTAPALNQLHRVATPPTEHNSSGTPLYKNAGLKNDNDSALYTPADAPDPKGSPPVRKYRASESISCTHDDPASKRPLATAVLYGGEVECSSSNGNLVRLVPSETLAKETLPPSTFTSRLFVSSRYRLAGVALRGRSHDLIFTASAATRDVEFSRGVQQAVLGDGRAKQAKILPREVLPQSLRRTSSASSVLAVLVKPQVAFLYSKSFDVVLQFQRAPASDNVRVTVSCYTSESASILRGRDEKLPHPALGFSSRVIARKDWRIRHRITVELSTRQSGKCLVAAEGALDEKIIFRKPIIRLVAIRHSCYGSIECTTDHPSQPAGSAGSPIGRVASLKSPAPQATSRQGVVVYKDGWFALQYAEVKFAPQPTWVYGSQISACRERSTQFEKRRLCAPCMAGAACPNAYSYIACDYPVWSPDGASECSTVPAGRGMLGVGVPPIECGDGAVTIDADAACHACPLGKQCSTYHQPVVIDCPPGTWSPPLSMSCVKCPYDHDCTGSQAFKCGWGSWVITGTNKCSEALATTTKGPYYDFDTKAPLIPRTGWTGFYSHMLTTTFVYGSNDNRASGCPPFAICSGEWYRLSHPRVIDVLKKPLDCGAGGSWCPRSWANVWTNDVIHEQMFEFEWSPNTLSRGGEDYHASDFFCNWGTVEGNKVNSRVISCKTLVDARLTGRICEPGSLKKSCTDKRAGSALLYALNSDVHSTTFPVSSGVHALRSIAGDGEDLQACNKGHWIAGRTCFSGTVIAKPGLPGTQFDWGVFFSEGAPSQDRLLKPCPESFYCPSPSVVSNVTCSAGYYCPLSTRYHCFHSTKRAHCTPTPQFIKIQCGEHRSPPEINPENVVPYQVAFAPRCFSIRSRRHAVITMKQIALRYCGDAVVYSGEICSLPCIDLPVIADIRWKEEFPCPPGTQSAASTGGEGGCRACAAGFGCITGAESQVCAKGYFCGEGSPHHAPYPCPEGYYGEVAGLQSQGACTKCAPGFVCNGNGVPLLCPAGHYCSEEGLTAITATRCPPGTYNSKEGASTSVDCLACPPGHVSLEEGSTKCTPCPAGYTSDAARTTCEQCKAGAMCSRRGSQPTPCPLGYYSDHGAVKCEACTGDQICDRTGLDKQAMLRLTACPMCKEVTDVTVDWCPAGYYCPTATSRPIPCPPGTFSSRRGAQSADSCVPTPAGTFVSYPGSVMEEGLCLRGYFCPKGSDTMTAQKCPPGTELLIDGGREEGDCTACPAGVTCLTLPSGDERSPCPPGHYCPAGTTWRPLPCPVGTYRMQTGGARVEDCLPCPPGSYCETAGLRTPTGSCAAGYICTGGAKSPTPTDGVTGNSCTPGGYCKKGAAKKTACPAGRYANTAGGSSVIVCVDCRPGEYCQGTTSDKPEGPCKAGFICPQRATREDEVAVKPAHYSEAGAVAEIPCPPGTFGLLYGQPACPPCPNRFVCNKPKMTVLTPCPVAHYCDEGSSAGKPCPIGTFSSSGLRGSVDECQKCPGGKYCAAAALAGTTGDCAAGYYCLSGAIAAAMAVKSDRGGPCPVGHYCPRGSENPLPCPIGTHGATEMLRDASECASCPAGSYCASMGLSTPTGPCNAGFYCPEGSKGPSAAPCTTGHYCPAGSGAPLECPEGTYQVERGKAACVKCPAGSRCSPGTDTLDKMVCPEGHVCNGSVMTSCPEGTFTDSPYTASVSECQPCLPGYICPIGAAPQPCPEGYYCAGNVGSVASLEVTGEKGGRCPLGSYCPQGISEPIPCDAGYICQQIGLRAPLVKCPPGRYCPGGTVSAATSVPCPPGYYCPEGASSPVRCPLGTYSVSDEAVSADQCVKCPAGKFCDRRVPAAPAGDCRAGYYCVEGSYSPFGAPCPAGSYCPPGSGTPHACPAGSVAPTAGLASCIECPAGYDCTGSTVKLCAKGYYCSGDGASRSCAVGTYNPVEGSADASSCLPCPAGQACRKPGTAVPENCKEGYFCLQSVSSLRPATISAEEAEAVVDRLPGAPTAGGGKCPTGFYCPEGSRIPLSCPGGWACGSAGLSEPLTECSGGFYCRRRAQSANPSGIQDDDKCPSTDNGGSCPAGYHCPPGSREPIPCPPGTYRALPMGKSLSECSPCQLGSFCVGFGLTVVSGPCKAGFYCPYGSQDDAPQWCPQGHYCPEGTGIPQKCPPKTYQPGESATSCLTCPAGFVCPDKGIHMPQYCPKGSYCPAGSSTPVPCPAGRYGPIAGLISEEECFWCLPGKLCETKGLSDSTVNCPEGYYCIAGAARLSRGPGWDIECNGNGPCEVAVRCPTGYICPEGAVVPLRCPVGQQLSGEGGMAADCKMCSAGHFCAVGGQTGVCAAGFVCTGSSYSPTPMNPKRGYICPAGHYCPQGAVREIPCVRGTLAPTLGYGEDGCDDCPAGWSCGNGAMSKLTDADKCPAGTFCSEGSVTPLLCQKGTYNPTEFSGASEDCRPCPAGMYCETEALKAPTGLCQAGTWCIQGSPQQDHAGAYMPDSIVVCPRGSYCPEGAPAPKQCEIGSYQENVGAPSACVACQPGKYCGTTGLGTMKGSGLCAAGFICKGGAVQAASMDGVTGQICEQGFYCPAGSSSPVDCPVGTYSDEDGLEACKPCLPGHLCKDKGVIEECPAGHYCPSGAQVPEPCPEGMYTREEGLDNSRQCFECPPGKVCDTTQQTDCPAGHVCLLGVRKSTMQQAEKDLELIWENLSFWKGFGIGYGGLCPAGHYCPSGSAVPQRCPPQKTRPQQGGQTEADCEECPVGHFCEDSLPVPFLCSPGYYCLGGQEEPVPCPAGSYSSAEGAFSKDVCTRCPPGFACSMEAIVHYGSLLCPVGYYCPAGTADPLPCPAGRYGRTNLLQDSTSCTACPAGKVCNGNSEAETPFTICPAGSYCPEGSSTAVSCPGGYYCPAGSVTPSACPEGYFCTAGSDQPTLCLPGTLCPATTAVPSVCPAGYTAKGYCEGSHTVEDCCKACPPGTYADMPGSVECKTCAGGYICTGTSTTAKPTIDPSTSTTEGYVCPVAHYCPAGAVAPIPCPPGTYRSTTEGSSLSSCTPCPYGTYQRLAAMTSCEPCGPNARSELLEGSTTCTCIGESRFYQVESATCPCFADHQPTITDEALDEEQDGRSPCQKLLHAKCESHQTRDALGNCLETVDCQKSCRGTAGIFLSSFGVCQCKHGATVSAQCNTTCKENLPTVSITSKGLVEYDPVANSSTTYLAGLPPSINAENLIFLCGKHLEDTSEPLATSCPLSFQRASRNGLDGLRRMPDSFRPSQSSGTTRYSPANNETAEAVEGTAPAAKTVYAEDANTVPRPVLCLSRGSVIVWELQDGVVPVYQKENLLNTNVMMDDTAFRELASQKVSPNFFAYTFFESGVFVFAASDNALEISVVAVVPDGVRCPAGTMSPTPLSTRSLSLLGVTSGAASLVLKPNWTTVIFGLLAIASGCALLLFGLWRCQRRHWLPSTHLIGVSSRRGEGDPIPEELAATTIFRDSRLQHHAVAFEALPRKGHASAAVVSLADATAKFASVDVDSMDTRLFQVLLEKLLDFQQVLQCFVDDELKALQSSCFSINSRIAALLLKTKQMLFVFPCEDRNPVSRHLATMTQALLRLLAGEAEMEEGAVDVKATSLEPEGGEETQEGEDVNSNIILCFELGGLALLDTLDHLWSATIKRHDEVPEELVERLQECLVDKERDPAYTAASLAAVYDQFCSGKALQQRKLKTHINIFKSAYLAKANAIRDLSENLRTMSITHFGTLFEMRDAHLRKLKEVEMRGLTEGILTLARWFESEKQTSTELFEPSECRPLPEDPGSLFNALVSEQREKVAEMCQELKRKIVVEIKQLVQTQQGELDALIHEQEAAYRTAAVNLLKKKQLYLKCRRDKEEKYFEDWTKALKKTLKRAAQDKDLQLTRDANNGETDACDLSAALEEKSLAQVALRRRLREDRHKLELKMLDLDHQQVLEICEKETSVLRNQVRSELTQFRMIIAKDVAANIDLAGHLGKKQLQAVLRQAVRDFEEGFSPAQEEGKEKSAGESSAGRTIDVTASLLEGLRKMLQEHTKAEDLETDMMQTVKKATEELRHLVASLQDRVEQERDSLRNQWLELTLKEAEARNDAWATAIEIEEGNRKEAEKQLVLHANKERMMRDEAQAEIYNLLHTMLTNGLEGRLRAFARIHKSLRRRRLKAWKQLAVNAMMLNASNIRHCWEDVVDSSQQEVEALDQFSERRMQLTRRISANIKRTINRDKKRRAQLRATLETATSLIAQPRGETGVGLEDVTLQQAIDAAANRQREEEFYYRKAELDRQLQEALRQLDQQPPRVRIPQDAADAASAEGERFQEEEREKGGEEGKTHEAGEVQVATEELEQKKADLIAAHAASVQRLEQEVNERLAEGQKKLMLNFWDLTVEMESRPQRLNALAHRVREDVDELFAAEKLALERDMADPAQRPNFASQATAESCDSGSQGTGGNTSYELRLLRLRKTRCKRLLDRLSRLADKEGPVAMAYVKEASEELERLRNEELNLKATQKAALERELEKLADEKKQAEKRLEQTLEQMQKEWEEKLDRAQMEGRARLDVTRQNARWHSSEAGNVDERRKQLLKWHQLEVQNLQEALDTEYVRQRRSLEEKLQHKMLLKRRRIIKEAEEELKAKTANIQKARDAFVSEQEPPFFFDEKTRREIVLRIAREWRQRASESARSRRAGEKSTAEQKEDENAENLRTLQRLNTAEFRQRVTILRRAAGHAIVEVCDTIRRLRPSPGLKPGQTARGASPPPHLLQLSGATDAIEEVVRDLRRINSLYYSALPQ